MGHCGEGETGHTEVTGEETGITKPSYSLCYYMCTCGLEVSFVQILTPILSTTALASMSDFGAYGILI